MNKNIKILAPQEAGIEEIEELSSVLHYHQNFHTDCHQYVRKHNGEPVTY